MSHPHAPCATAAAAARAVCAGRAGARGAAARGSVVPIRLGGPAPHLLRFGFGARRSLLIRTVVPRPSGPRSAL
ncbi:hypothetical protein [Streptomyces hypolithicus]